MTPTGDGGQDPLPAPDRRDGTRTRASARRRAWQAAVLGVAALGALGYASFEFAAHVPGSAGAASGAAASAAAVAGGHPARSAAPVSAPPATAPAIAPSAASHQSTAPQPQTQTIVPVSAIAFGPDGTADGDNPRSAGHVITDPASGWLTQWYATASFGGLKAGTGLLLDMGRTVTITSVRLTLGGLPGARVELRLGTVPSLQHLAVARTATATAAVLTLKLARAVRARYVLLWFTHLPPDGAGTYQVFVHQVTVDGIP